MTCEIGRCTKELNVVPPLVVRHIRGTQIILLFFLVMLVFSTASGITSVSFEWVPQGSANLSQTDMHVKAIHGEHIR